jgi:hypothetical protein
MHTCTITPSASLVVNSTEPLTFDGMQWVPYGTYFDTELQCQVDLFHPTDDMLRRITDSGSQWLFFMNNANRNNDNQYAIKILKYPYRSSQDTSREEAFSTFQRQQLASLAGLAPPCQRMVKIMGKDKENRPKVYWGYTTSVASNIGEYGSAECYEDEFQDWYHEKRQAWDAIESLRSAYDNLISYCSDVEDMTDEAEQTVEENYPSHIESVEEYCEWRGYDLCGDLKESLENVDISGTQVYHEALGVVYTTGHLGSDLHSANIGTYQGNTVCIDFGYHSISYGDYRRER